MAVVNGSFESAGATPGSASGWTRTAHSSRTSFAPFSGDNLPIERWLDALYQTVMIGTVGLFSSGFGTSSNESWEQSGFLPSGILPENILAAVAMTDAAWDGTLALPAEDFEDHWDLWVPSFTNALLIPWNAGIVFHPADNFVMRYGVPGTGGRSAVFGHHLASEEVSGTPLSTGTPVTAAEFVAWFLGTFGRDDTPDPFTASVVTYGTAVYVLITAAATGTPPVDHLFIPVADSPGDTGWSRAGLPADACSWFTTLGDGTALTAGLFDGDAYDSIEWESAITEWTYPTDARLTAAVFDVGTILEGPVENFEGVWDSW